MQPVCLLPGLSHRRTRALATLLATLFLIGASGCSKTEPDPAPSAEFDDQIDSAALVEAGMTGAEAALLEESAVTGYRTPRLPLYVYRDAGIASFQPDGWMGDYNDIKLNAYCELQPRSGKTCVRIEYLPGATQNSKWAGVFWQFPGNSWNKRKAGYDLTGAKKLRFWARGEKGGEVIQEVKMGGISGKFKDSDTAGIGPITLTKEWQEFEIDLSGIDLSYISGGFCWSTNLDLNRDGCTFYLDDIVYE
jgi:hypothetical protein